MGNVNYNAENNLTEMEKYYKALYEAEKKKNEELTTQLEKFKNPLSLPNDMVELEKGEPL